MATDRRAWATERTWAIKGVSDRTRAAALKAAHGAGLTVGQWVEQVLARAAEEARYPKPSPAGAAVTELINQRLRPVEEELGRIAERLASLEGRIDRGGRPEPADETAAPPSPAVAEPEASERAEAGPAGAPRRRPGRQRRELPEPVRLRIEELHGAGRSMYAISKELGIPYSVVYAYVKALGGRAPS